MSGYGCGTLAVRGCDGLFFLRRLRFFGGVFLLLGDRLIDGGFHECGAGRVLLVAVRDGKPPGVGGHAPEPFETQLLSSGFLPGFDLRGQPLKIRGQPESRLALATRVVGVGDDVFGAVVAVDGFAADFFADDGVFALGDGDFFSRHGHFRVGTDKGIEHQDDFFRGIQDGGDAMQTDLGKALEGEFREEAALDLGEVEFEAELAGFVGEVGGKKERFSSCGIEDAQFDLAGTIREIGEKAQQAGADSGRLKLGVGGGRGKKDQQPSHADEAAELGGAEDGIHEFASCCGKVTQAGNSASLELKGRAAG